MNAEELIEEIKYMRALQAQHKKLLRKTELQVAGFGAHVPAYLEVEKDDLEAKILACDEKIKTLKQQAIAIKQDELNAFQAMIKVLSNDAAIMWIFPAIYTILLVRVEKMPEVITDEMHDRVVRMVDNTCNRRIRELENDIQRIQNM